MTNTTATRFAILNRLTGRCYTGADGAVATWSTRAMAVTRAREIGPALIASVLEVG